MWRMSSAMLKGVRTGQVLGTQDAKMGVMILVGTIPIVVVGVLFKNAIETTLRSLYIIALTMIVLALMLALAEYLMHERLKRNVPLKSLEQVGWWECLVVGFAQCFALIPGASRSGVTITGGLLLGLERESAARFSFLLSLPSVFAAGIFQLIKSREALLASANDAVALLVATLVSGVIGYASIAFLLGYLRKNSTLIFILYRIAVGIALLSLLLSEKLPAD
jgi:undecaprenyl-diphosphatase